MHPVHVWLLATPSNGIRECEWFVLALIALNAMVILRGVFARGGEEQVRAKTRDLLSRAWQDLLAS